MPYPTVSDLRVYLSQLPATLPPRTEQELTAILADARAIVDGYLGYSFDGYTTVERRVLGHGSHFLNLPTFSPATVSGVLVGDDPDSVAVSNWREVDGTLYHPSAHWGLNTVYRVTADFGYGDPPGVVRAAVIQVAVNLWHNRGLGYFADVVGTPGVGAIRASTTIPESIQAMLARFAVAATPPAV